MALAGNRGVSLTIARPGASNLHARLFGESQGRYLVAVPPTRLTALVQRAGRAGVLARVIGTTGGDRLTVGEGQSISLAELRELNQAWLPNYMADAAEAR
jgi:phosphoribosylformylglycinamidine synthase